MKRIFAAAAILIAASLNAAAYADAAVPAPATKQTHVVKAKPARHKARVRQTTNHEVTYDRDSKDPNVGWHTQGGMRVCAEDCDNPEIPGSGYTCRDVNILGMAMRECDWSSW